ncbi:MAG TPA: hypothetical protein VNJ01_02480 [Bacteriovoracaceae bacterium]|nr:hypothetical protein [Bacteriovoracaceae bacterium]
MNKLTVMAKNQNTYFVKRLIQEVGKGSLFLFDPWKDPLESPQEGRVLVRTTGVYGDERDLEILERFFAPEEIINTLPTLRVLRNKKLQYQIFPTVNIPALPWLDLQHASVPMIRAFLVRHPGSRFLVKPHRGQGGWGIETFSREQMLTWTGDRTDKEFILQPYLEGWRELRCFFIDDWCLSLERENSGGAASNFTAGGTARLIDLPPSVKELVGRIRKHFQLTYGAIDFLQQREELITLEINSAPGVEQLEAITGVNVMRKLVDQLGF